jgi:hypothetical protein
MAPGSRFACLYGPSKPRRLLRADPKGWKWERTKPESNTIQGSYQNMSVPGGLDHNFAGTYELGERLNSFGKRTKPESDTIQSCYQNMLVPGDSDPDFGGGYEARKRVIRWVEWLRKRTKPESDRRQGTYKNMSVGSGPASRNWNRSGQAPGLGKLFEEVKTAMTLTKRIFAVISVSSEAGIYKKTRDLWKYVESCGLARRGQGSCSSELPATYVI